MKFILILFFVLLSIIANSQSSITQICKICDSIATRHCGAYKKVVYEKINAKKLKADLKVIASIESFLLDSKPTNFIIDSNYDIDYSTIISDSTKSLEKKIMLNYFEIYLFDFILGGIRFKYAAITNLNTSFCALNNEKDIKGEFGKRLIKSLLNKIKINMLF